MSLLNPTETEKELLAELLFVHRRMRGADLEQEALRKVLGRILETKTLTGDIIRQYVRKELAKRKKRLALRAKRAEAARRG